MRWFQSVGKFVNGREIAKATDAAVAGSSESKVAKGA